MARCPKCGSSAQPKLLTTEYNEDGWDIEIVRTYICGCGCTFTGTSYYHCQEGYEITEEVPKKIIQEKLFGRLKEFTDKYPEGYHITLKDGDFETTISGSNNVTKNSYKNDDVVKELLNLFFGI